MTTDALDAVLERSRGLGFLGPGPVEAQRRHSEAFVGALGEGAGTVVDLGSGGGVPGLVVAAARPDCHVVLLDATAKRCRFLEWAVDELGLDATVLEGRAEELGRGSYRGRAVAVLARSFGPPAPTAECAAPFLMVGGRLIVSEPPDGPDRWAPDPLVELGLAPRERLVGPPVLQVLDQVGPCPDRFARRTGIPAKRPLF